MWELDCKERWVPKNWCFWTVVLEKTIESPLNCKKIQPVHFGDQPWDFFGRSDAKAETPVLWPLHAKSWLIGKDSDAGRDWGQEEKGMTEDEMAGRHHQLDGCESEWTPGVGDGHGGLLCCNSWGRKELDTTEWLNWTEGTYLHLRGKEGWKIQLLALRCSQYIKMWRKYSKYIGMFTPTNGTTFPRIRRQKLLFPNYWHNSQTCCLSLSLSYEELLF